jgi:hypothetical protein
MRYDGDDSQWRPSGWVWIAAGVGLVFWIIAVVVVWKVISR